MAANSRTKPHQELLDRVRRERKVMSNIKLGVVVASLLAGEGGNTLEGVAARLALIGHAPGRFACAEWICSAVQAGDAIGALDWITAYAVKTKAEIPMYEWEKDLLG